MIDAQLASVAARFLTDPAAPCRFFLKGESDSSRARDAVVSARQFFGSTCPGVGGTSVTMLRGDGGQAVISFPPVREQNGLWRPIRPPEEWEASFGTTRLPEDRVVTLRMVGDGEGGLAGVRKALPPDRPTGELVGWFLSGILDRWDVRPQKVSPPDAGKFRETGGTRRPSSIYAPFGVRVEKFGVFVQVDWDASWGSAGSDRYRLEIESAARPRLRIGLTRGADLVDPNAAEKLDEGVHSFLLDSGLLVSHLDTGVEVVVPDSIEAGGSFALSGLSMDASGLFVGDGQS